MDDIDRVQQRTISAAGAARLGVDPAISSPFALGAKYLEEVRSMDRTESPAAADAETTTVKAKRGGPRGPHLGTRVRMTIESCAPITEAKLVETLDPADPKRVRDLVVEGAKEGRWRRKRDGSGGFLIELASAPAAAAGERQERGLKGFLQRQGGKAARKPAAQRAAHPRGGVAHPKARKAPVKAAASGRGRAAPMQLLPVAPAPTGVPGEPELDCGLHNTGDLHIALGDQKLVLKKRHTRALVDYLDKIAAAVREE